MLFRQLSCKTPENNMNDSSDVIIYIHRINFKNNANNITFLSIYYVLIVYVCASNALFTIGSTAIHVTVCSYVGEVAYDEYTYKLSCISTQWLLIRKDKIMGKKVRNTKWFGPFQVQDIPKDLSEGEIANNVKENKNGII